MPAQLAAPATLELAEGGALFRDAIRELAGPLHPLQAHRLPDLQEGDLAEQAVTREASSGRETIAVMSVRPAAAQLDHLECFAVKDPTARASYTADVDGLVAEPGCKIRVPARFACAPVSKTDVTPAPPGGGGTGRPNTFVCYVEKCAQTSLPTVSATDQFGSRTLTPRRTKLLCAPARDPVITTTTTLPGPCACDATGCCRLPGGNCVNDNNCCRGFCNSASGRCNCGGPGTACVGDHDCCFGWSCDATAHCVCTPPGSACATSGECCDVYCNAAGVCGCDADGTPCSPPGADTGHCCSGFCDASGQCRPRHDHLECFSVRDPQARTSYTATFTGQSFSDTGCQIRMPGTIACVPASKTNVIPAPPGVGATGTPNPFVCYGVKCPKRSGSILLAADDQFGQRYVETKRATRLCAPATPATTTTTTTPVVCVCFGTGCCLSVGAPCVAGVDCCSATCDGSGHCG